jgi:nucleotide-binding universal stress UspA family protein
MDRGEEPAMQIRKILVPVDFSDASRRALDEAIGFAKAFGAELELLHCFQFLPEIVELYGVETPRSFESDVSEAARKRLQEWSESARARGVAVSPHLAMQNIPSDEIVERAGALGVDWIVMGTKGLSGIKHVLLGSVAEKVVRLAPCPVLTVSGAGAARSGDAPRAIAKILVPVDFSEPAGRAFDEAVELATKFGSELHLLHCYQLYPTTVSPYGVVVPETFEREIRTAAQQRLSEWREKAATRGVRAHEHVTAHFPSEEIVAASERLGIDLIVIGTRGLSGIKHVLLGSVAERTIRQATCPVLTVKKRALG